jgi:SEC-C motif/Protein of unknown function (DUF2384)
MIQVLGSGAMEHDELLAALAADGSLGSGASLRHQVDRILQLDTAFAHAGEKGEKACFLPALTDGVSWTVRIDAADGYVRMHPALSAIGWWLVGDGADLVGTDDGVLGRLTTDGIWLDDVDTDVVCGPAGWLDALTSAWAAFTATDGAVRVDSVSASPPATARQVAAVRAGYEALAETSDAVLFDGARQELTTANSTATIHEALLADREAFVVDPVPYLPDLFAAAGLEERRETLVDAGFDWEALETRRSRNRMGFVYGLDEPGIDRLMLLVGACLLFAERGIESFGDTDEEQEGAAILLSALLEDGDVAEAFWDEYDQRGGTISEIAAFVNELAERTGDARLVGLQWAQARGMELIGEVRASVELLESIVGPGCEYQPALLDAAAVAADRGDAQAAARLLLRAGVEGDIEDDDPDDAERLWREVAGFASNRPKPIANRNDRCPCGSGKKYKACHLGTERHSLDDRASWLWDKAARYVRRNDPTLLTDLAWEITEAMPGGYREMASSPFTVDLALHEHELFAEFLDDRGWLLPEDEQLLAAQWALVDRGVFEMLEARGDRLRLRDIGRGETITVVNATASPGSGPGTTMLGRPLPVGDTYRALGGFLPLPRHLVNPMLDAINSGQPDQLVAQIASMLQPTRLRNTSGEELMFHTIRWQVADADHDAVDQALVAAGFRDDNDDEWSLTADTPGMRDAIIATLRLDTAAGELTANVNSDERAALTRTRVDAALPGARLIADERKTLEDLEDERDPDAPPVPSLDQNDPEIQAFMDELIASKEVEWIDTEIPALGGRTPRAAVQDPIGREEVRQLLDSWPEPPPGFTGGFRASRLRALLELDG